MDLVKKNILSIICGVVALAAIIFHLVYTSGQYAKLGAAGKARADKAATVTGLLGEPRSFPAVRDDVAPPKLERFPNPQTIAIADGLAAQLHAEATKLMTKAVEINRAGYDLLVPGSLPRPNDPQKYDFRDAYNAVMVPGGQPKAYDPQRPLVNLPDGVLKSAVPPTDAEIAAEKVKLWKEQYAPKIIVVNNQLVNQKEVVDEFRKAIATFDVDFRRKRAQNFKVYLEPGALGMHPQLIIGSPGAKTAPSAEAMWYAQMSFWVQQDVCRAVARMNERFANIPAAPVKHLVSLAVKHDGAMYARSGGPAPAADGAAAPAGAKNYAVSSTGRVCNPMYDVVLFDVHVVVDHAVVKEFLRQLQFGKFVTVTHMEMQSVDLADAVDAGYDYGPRPVVELTIKCEALFLREWTVQNDAGPMPKTVQALLGIGLPVAAVAPVEGATEQVTE